VLVIHPHAYFFVKLVAFQKFVFLVRHDGLLKRKRRERENRLLFIKKIVPASHSEMKNFETPLA
jgi:hypothetical protein